MGSVVACLSLLRVIETAMNLWIDLPELISIQLGNNAFQFHERSTSTQLVMRSSDKLKN